MYNRHQGRGDITSLECGDHSFLVTRQSLVTGCLGGSASSTAVFQAQRAGGSLQERACPGGSLGTRGRQSSLLRSRRLLRLAAVAAVDPAPQAHLAGVFLQPLLSLLGELAE